MAAEHDDMLLDIESIRPPELDPPDQPDPLSKSEANSYNNRLADARLRSLNQDIDERRKYARRIFWLIAVWLYGLGLIILFQGFWDTFSLPEGVLIAIIGGTTVSVLGIFGFVAKYLFHRKD